MNRSALLVAALGSLFLGGCIVNTRPVVVEQQPGPVVIKQPGSPPIVVKQAPGPIVIRQTPGGTTIVQKPGAGPVVVQQPVVIAQPATAAKGPPPQAPAKGLRRQYTYTY